MLQLSRLFWALARSLKFHFKLQTIDKLVN